MFSILEYIKRFQYMISPKNEEINKHDGKYIHFV